MVLRADELAAIRATITSYLPDQATNSRTAITTPCRLAVATRPLHLPDVPMSLRPNSWDIRLVDAADIRPGDTLVLTDGYTNRAKGTYCVMIDPNPQSYSVCEDVTAVMIQRPDGAPVLFANTSVTFRQRGSAGTQMGTTTPCLFEPLGAEPLISAGGYTVSHLVIWCDPVTFPDGQLVSVDDEVLVSDAVRQARNLKRRDFALGVVRHYTAPFPYAVAYLQAD